MDAFDRTELLIGKEKLNILKKSSVALFGVGGVGGFTAEALVRSGIENITVFDGDVVELSNKNRQIIATDDVLGKDKVEVIKKRLLSINKDLSINVEKVFYLPENADNYDLSKYDYIIDAIDTVSAKIDLVIRAKKAGVKIISCMGTGGKLYPEKLKVSDIYKTQVCPLAKVMRYELKRRGIDNLKVVYSDEIPVKGEEIPSMIFVPASAGILIAREVVLDLIKEK